MARFSFFVLVLALSLNLTACKKELSGPAPTADPSAGEVMLMVSERQTAETPESAWRDAGGVLEVTYQTDEATPKVHDKSLAFTGMLRVPLALTGAQNLYRLTQFVVLATNGDKTSPLASLNSKDVNNLIGDTRYGVNVHIVVTQEGNVAPDLRITKNYAAPPSFPIQKEFRSIKIGFSDPSVILTTQDLEGALRKLKTIASATEKYHQELLDLITKAQAIDTAHLNLLLDAVYFTAADLKRLQQTQEELEKLPYSEENNQLRNLVREKISFARNLSHFCDSIATAGVSKLTDLSADGLVSILNRSFGENYYDQSSFDKALKIAIAKTLPMSVDTKLAILAITAKMSLPQTSALLALSWFTEDSDHSINTLIGLLKQLEDTDARGPVALGGLKLIDSVSVEQAKAFLPLSGNAQLDVANALAAKLGSAFDFATFFTFAQSLSYSDKDSFIIQHIQSFQLSAAQAAKLTALGYERKLEIGKLAVGQISVLTGTDLHSIASQLSYSDKDSLILAGVARLKTVTVTEATTLIGLGYEKKLQIATECSNRVRNLSASTLTELVKQLSYSDKDSLALSGLDLIASVQVAEIKNLVPNSYENKLAIAKKALPKVKALTGAQLAEVAALLSYSDKDSLLAFGAPQVGTLTLAETKQLIAVSYETKEATAIASLPKIAGLTGAQLKEVALLFSWGEKDRVILAGLKSISALSVVETAGLLATAYEQKTAVAKAMMSKLPNLSSSDVVTITAQAGDEKLPVAQMGLAKVVTVYASDAITIAAALSYSHKDTIIADAMTRMQPVNMANLIALSKASYEDSRKIAILKNGYLKATDLSVSTLLTLMQAVSWGDKDSVAVGFLNIWPSLSTDELILISKAAYEKKADILIGAFVKTTDRTVASALKVVLLLSWGEKDTFLLQAVDQVTDLTAENLATLSKGAYEKETEILKKGLARLGRM